MPDAPDYRLTLRPLAAGCPADVRLRRALKCLLGRFGLRCLAVEQLPGPLPAGSKRPGGPPGTGKGHP
jgi:hypothetical protein